MVVFGGIISTKPPNSIALNDNGCNATVPPLLVLNTNTFEWASEYQPELAYKQPKAVIQAIGGRLVLKPSFVQVPANSNTHGSNTGNSPQQPSGGFDNPNLYSIFSKRHTAQPTSNATSSDSGNSGSSTPVGAIAGGVIGGVAAIAIVVSILLYLRRRRRRQQQQSGPETSQIRPEVSEADGREILEAGGQPVFELPGDTTMKSPAKHELDSGQIWSTGK